MTNLPDLSRITVLVPGKLSDHAGKRIDKIFNMVRMDTADPARITPELAEKVRGIAAFGGISAAFMDALPKLEIVASFGVGYDSVDAAHAGKKSVMVTNTPDVLTEEVADTALGF
jgi:lactate dehydrogenase-like 2-hydroxyacid dehydrogenase